jgi:hypothetical protein
MMNPTRNPNEQPMDAGYMPYAYHAGIFQTYGQFDRPSESHPVYRSPAAADFSGPLTWRQGDHPQTVEQIIASGYFAVPRSEPETAIISDKQHVARTGLDDLIGQIRGRLTLYQQNMYELAYSVCEASNSVHRQVADQGRPADNRQQYSAQKQVQKLYEQQRLERVNLWRDVSRLRLVLPENLQSYLGAYRKLAVLADVPGNDIWGGGDFP